MAKGAVHIQNLEFEGVNDQMHLEIGNSRYSFNSKYPADPSNPHSRKGKPLSHGKRSPETGGSTS